ncbi:MAG: NAD-dependent epimerase/dehydratase family protein [bacterium]|nr:NAD-dependent epimerase/dehydratase family protein [bacterium]
MRALITGVAGFIGAHVAEAKVRDGWQVAGIDDLSGGSTANIPEGVEFIQHDCCQPLDSIFARFQPEVVFHLAAYAAEGLSHHIPNFNYHNNLIGTSNVLAAAYRANVRHFVFTSSIAAYGHPTDERPLTESTACRPCDPYGVAKYACEQHIAAFHAYYGGPNYTILRPHNVFGPKQNIADPFRNVVGIFFRCIQAGLPLPVFGDGSQSRNFSYIDVVAKCIAACAEQTQARNQIFNVGGDEVMTVLDLARCVQRITGKDTGIQHLAERQEVKHAIADHRKVRSVFPEVFEAGLSIEAGLEQTAEFLRQRAIPKKTSCPAPIEILDRLPPSWRDDLGPQA